VSAARLLVYSSRVGYVRRWRRLPVAMAVAYAILASQCAVHTFVFLQHDTRFREMAVEYAEYALILLYLFRPRHIAQRPPARDSDSRG
jgi:hypothetical protein